MFLSHSNLEGTEKACAHMHTHTHCIYVLHEPVQQICEKSVVLHLQFYPLHDPGMLVSLMRTDISGYLTLTCLFNDMSDL